MHPRDSRRERLGFETGTLSRPARLLLEPSTGGGGVFYLLKVRPRVSLEQPHMEILVNHEV